MFVSRASIGYVGFTRFTIFAACTLGVTRNGVGSRAAGAGEVFLGAGAGVVATAGETWRGFVAVSIAGVAAGVLLWSACFDVGDKSEGELGMVTAPGAGVPLAGVVFGVLFEAVSGICCAAGATLADVAEGGAAVAAEFCAALGPGALCSSWPRK